MASIKENFAANLRRLLRLRHLRQRDLSEKLGTSDVVVSRWVNGKAFPEAAQLDRIAEIFEVSYQELVKCPGTADLPDVKVSSRDLDAVLRNLARVRGFDLVKRKG